MKKFLEMVVVAAIWALPAAAFAGSNVAVAYSNSTQDVGFAEADSESAASDKAMSECGKGGAGDCEIAFSGADMCVSLARATSSLEKKQSERYVAFVSWRKRSFGGWRLAG